ncbi:hypothetical protein KUCAC02_020217, partial [Chaenocephalus aceratus]
NSMDGKQASSNKKRATLTDSRSFDWLSRENRDSLTPRLKRLSDKAVSCEDTLPGYSAAITTLLKYKRALHNPGENYIANGVFQGAEDHCCIDVPRPQAELTGHSAHLRTDSPPFTSKTNIPLGEFLAQQDKRSSFGQPTCLDRCHAGRTRSSAFLSPGGLHIRCSPILRAPRGFLHHPEPLGNDVSNTGSIKPLIWYSQCVQAGE